MPLAGATVPHDVIGNFGAAKVLIRPASAGTGVIAGGAIRAIMQAAGIKDVLTKCMGTRNPHNVVRATIDALRQLMSPDDVAEKRGLVRKEVA